MSTTTNARLAILATGAMLALGACDRTPPPAADKPAADKPGSSVSLSAAEKAPLAKQTIRASGSSALQPLVNAAKEKFETDNRSVSVEVSAGGSKKGLADVASGAVHSGNSDIFAPDDM